MPDIPRQTALRSLLELDKGAARPDSLITRFCAENSLQGRDRAFVAELTYGVMRHLRALDFILSLGASKPPESMDPPVLFILRMGLYQALAMDRARFAAVNESVELAKSQRSTLRAAGFVNAALRQTLRRIDKAQMEPAPIWQVVARFQQKDLPPQRKLGERYSFPDFMVGRWLKNYGAELTEKVLLHCQEKSAAYIRPNQVAYTPLQVSDMLEQYNIEVEPFEMAEGLWKVVHGQLAPDSPLISQGVVQPQDGASYLAASLLAPGAEDTVLDICCGKGIKSGLFGQTARQVLAFDLNFSLLKSLQTNMTRQGIGSVTPVVGDMSSPWPVRGSFSHIFIDAPCSGTGLVRRHPEGKWRKDIQLIERMSRVQGRILEQAVENLGVGGKLVYAICSVEPEEGRHNVNVLLGAHKNLTRIPVSAINPRLRDLQTEEGDMLILPGMHGIDGFFASVLHKGG